MSKKSKQNSKQHEVEFMKQEYTGIAKAFGDLYYVIVENHLTHYHPNRKKNFTTSFIKISSIMECTQSIQK
jgi:hypothetical protein